MNPLARTTRQEIMAWLFSEGRSVAGWARWRGVDYYSTLQAINRFAGKPNKEPRGIKTFNAMKLLAKDMGLEV